MSREFLDFVEDILDGMDKAEILLERVSYSHMTTLISRLSGTLLSETYLS